MNAYHRVLVVFLGLWVLALAASAQPPALINHQGRLVDGTNLVNDTVEIVFRMYHQDMGGAPQYAETQTVVVVDGLYSAMIGASNASPTALEGALDGETVYLEIAVDGTALSPRERLICAPYAMVATTVPTGSIETAMLADQAVTGAKIADGTVTFADIGPNGASSGQVMKWNGIAWAAGNDAAPSLASYDENGTFSPAPVASGADAIAQGAGAAVLGPGSVVGGGKENTIQAAATNAVVAGGWQNVIESGAGWSVIGGGYGNTNKAGAHVATIGGGSWNVAHSAATVGGGSGNWAASQLSTIGGGQYNAIGQGVIFPSSIYTADYAVVAGGYLNGIYSDNGTIGGGQYNYIGTNANAAAIAGGEFCSARATAAAIGGGATNQINEDCPGAVIGGGIQNTVEAGATNAVIAGGWQNVIETGAGWSVIAGGYGNTNRPGAHVATIGGGSWNVAQSAATVGGGTGNWAESPLSTIGGGQYNAVGRSLIFPTFVYTAEYAVVAGGYQNRIYSDAGAIGGGRYNAIGADANDAAIAGGNACFAGGDGVAIGGGHSSVVETNSPYATISGGATNRIYAGSPGAVIGGGRYHDIREDSPSALIAGGENNWIQDHSDFSVIGGGGLNGVGPNAPYAVIPGGYENRAQAASSFAAGRFAYAQHEGAFVWNDAIGNPFSSTAPNQFLISADRVGIETDSPSEKLEVVGNVKATGFIGDGSGLTGVAPGQNSVSSTQIVDGTVTFADIGSNGASSGQVMKWNGSAWTAADDVGGALAGYDENGTFASAPSATGTDAIAQGAGASAAGNYAVVGGGSDNLIQSGGVKATIGGGGMNTILSAGDEATIGGGVANTNASSAGVIGGGWLNQLPGLGSCKTIGGGQGNRVEGSSSYASIGGGVNNVISNDAREATIAGGWQNIISANSENSTIGGGLFNKIGPNGTAATVPGGWSNWALGEKSFAAGYAARAGHDGAFVWADDDPLGQVFASTAANQFLVRARGGVGIGTNVTPQMLTVAGNVQATGFIGSGAGLTGVTPAVNSVGSAQIANGSVAFADIGQNGAGNWQVMKWNGSTWTAAADNDTDTTAMGGDLTGSQLNAQLVAGAVGSTEIADNSVTGTDITDNSVTSADIANETVGTADINFFQLNSVYDSRYVNQSGDTMTGPLAMSSYNITGVYDLYASDAVKVGSSGQNEVFMSQTGRHGSTGSWDPNPGSSYPGLWLEYGENESGGFYADGDVACIWSPGDADILRIYDEDSFYAPVFVIDGSGEVGIGVTGPVYRLEITGNAGKPGGGSWAATSDARLKEDVRDLDSALDEILRLRGVSYEWIHPDEHDGETGRRTGMLAQEVEAVFPDWVSEVEPRGQDAELVAEGETVKSLHFPNAFNAYVVEAIRELNNKVERLEAENQELKQAVIDSLTSAGLDAGPGHPGSNNR